MGWCMVGCANNHVLMNGRYHDCILTTLSSIYPGRYRARCALPYLGPIPNHEAVSLTSGLLSDQSLHRPYIIYDLRDAFVWRTDSCVCVLYIYRKSDMLYPCMYTHAIYDSECITRRFVFYFFKSWKRKTRTSYAEVWTRLICKLFLSVFTFYPNRCAHELRILNLNASRVGLLVVCVVRFMSCFSVNRK